MLNIKIELDERNLRELIVEFLKLKFNHDIKVEKVQILVKSKENYKAEWERAAFKAIYEESL